MTSTEALTNPYDNNVTVDSTAFLKNDYLMQVITDTHYDNPDRKGRHICFLARILQDWNIPAKGIACDEYTAVCISTDGIASVFGDYPTYDDNAYFLQSNCELNDPTPENCAPGQPLHWYSNGLAVKIYRVKGTSSGSNTFNLNNWQNGNGGTWHHWYVQNGTLYENAATAPNCNSLTTKDLTTIGKRVTIYPNPSTDGIFRIATAEDVELESLQIMDVNGRLLHDFILHNVSKQELSFPQLSPGLYLLYIHSRDGNYREKLLITN